MPATLLAPLTGGVIVSRTCGSSPGGGGSAPIRPKDRGLNGIKTPERTRPTSAPGYMPRHPTPRTLKPLAVREVDGGVNLRYLPPCSDGDFCNRGARRACTSSFLSPTASRSLLPSPNNNISILVRVFFSWHAHESGPPRWARMSTVWVRFCFCKYVSAANPHLLRFSQICPRLATFWSFSLLRRNRRPAAQSQDQTYIFLMCRI